MFARLTSGLSAAVLFSCLAFSFLSPAHAATAAVGTTPGEFMVDTLGGAHYDIPIAVPPGVAGMQPMLSLNYDSHGGDSLMGIGWSLGGLSAISRCPATQVQDGFRGSVNFDGNDRFCLEGQRLILISGSYYGAPNSEYRTELDGFSKIVAYGNQAGAPQYFKVWSKSGQVLDYGNSLDSYIEAGHPSANVWAVNRISDTVGNYLTVSYTEDAVHYTPNNISYVGNSVRFQYQPRPDVTSTYHAGAPIRNTERLSSVQTFASVAGVDTLVRDYRLGYDNNGSAGRTRLISLTECAGDGVCLPATSFTWQTGGTGHSQTLYTTSFSAQTGGDRYTYTADLNGDSKTDLILTYQGTNELQTFLADGDGTFTQTLSTGNFSPQSIANWNLYPADINGDGKTDLIFKYPTSNQLQTFLSDGDGTFTQTLYTAAFSPQGSASWDLHPSDINGDGKTDLILKNFTGNELQTFLSDGDGTFTQTLYTTAFSPQGSGGWDVYPPISTGIAKPIWSLNIPAATSYKRFCRKAMGYLLKRFLPTPSRPRAQEAGMYILPISTVTARLI